MAVRTSRFVILILLEEMIVGVCSETNSGADVCDFSTGFYYEGSGGGSGGSANTYVNNAYHDSGSQNSQRVSLAAIR